MPLRDAAAVNATRYKLVEALRVFGLPIGTWTGGRTRWNRARFAVEKTHALDALCVGGMAGVRPGTLKMLVIKANDRVRAVVPGKRKTAGSHVGRVQVRKSGWFSIKTRDQDLDGISARYVHLIQRADGYAYAVA